jgi:hypothetical protein
MFASFSGGYFPKEFLNVCSPVFLLEQHVSLLELLLRHAAIPPTDLREASVGNNEGV